MDCLFELMNDDGFKQRMVPPKYAELNAFLHEKHDVSLHLLLSSSSRSFLSALCRRIAHLEALSNKAIDFYKRQAEATEEGNPTRMMNPQLQQAYQRMQQVTSSSIINVGDFEKLLNVLGSDVRQAYQAFLPAMAKNQQNPPQGKQLDVAVKAMQIQFEMGMLLASSPSSAFIPVIKKLFTKDLPVLRNGTDPAELFFANFELLGVQDDKPSLATRKNQGVYVDVFTGREINRSSSNGRWRRCTRCAAVMVDVFGSRPGFTFVLSQQRKCFCGGHWALLPKEKLVL